MKKIGILSDTHGFVHQAVLNFLHETDEIWHAGDIGTPEVLEQLRKIKPVRAVFGNVDGHALRSACQEIERFNLEKVDVLMIHIGGYPGKYAPGIRSLITQTHPGLFVCGHSHILRVMFDKVHNLLYVNPGAAGKYGIHKSITAVRLVVDGSTIKDLEVLDVPRNYKYLV